MMETERDVTMATIRGLNAVEGFSPEELLMEELDPQTGETRQRLPVLAQVAWYRLKYPEGRIAVDISESDAKIMARARVYRHYQDATECFLAEAVACCELSLTSARELAQNDAVGQALLRAGFGLQFLVQQQAKTETNGMPPGDKAAAAPSAAAAPPASPPPASPPAQPEPKAADPLAAAMELPCPISKYQGKTLGDLIIEDPKALTWIATKFTGNAEIAAGAKLICEQARQETA